MKIHLYHPVHFEKWDYRHLETGIGGSETCQIELAWRLAKRGYEVHSYAPLRDDTQREWRGSHWHTLEEAGFDDPGLWILFRCPSVADQFAGRPGQQIWLMCQDEDYPGQFNEERATKFDRILALCGVHEQYLAERHPEIKDSICQWSNGVRMDVIREVEAEGISRNPKKLIYASSPDRGLFNLFKVFTRAREFDPALELHVFYGTNNIDVIAEKFPHLKHRYGDGFKSQLEQGINTPGVYWHGRVSQRDLIRHWFSAGLWCYPTMFSETNCITSMEAQCCGAIPITNPYWALKQHIKHGVFIAGNPDTDPLVLARYVTQVLALSSNNLEDQRRAMMSEARIRCNWERWVDVMDSWIQGIDPVGFQFVFQRKWSKGRILNVGCADDPAGFNGEATHLDLSGRNPLTGQSSATVTGDIRCLPDELTGCFDTVVLGDILEHLSERDSQTAVEQATHALRNGGRIVMTVPDDPRCAKEQGSTQARLPEYAPGIPAYHWRRISRKQLIDQIERVGLRMIHYEEIDYEHFRGHGIVAEVSL